MQCGLKEVPLDWWPLTRDCLAYGITVSILICIIHDERVEWYEALTLVLLYTVYILIMYFDKSIQKCARGKNPFTFAFAFGIRFHVSVGCKVTLNLRCEEFLHLF